MLIDTDGHVNNSLNAIIIIKTVKLTFCNCKINCMVTLSNAYVNV